MPHESHFSSRKAVSPTHNPFHNLQWLPPPDERLMEGLVDKKTITSKGLRFHSRYAVLSKDVLAFAKQRIFDERDSRPMQAQVNEMLQNLPTDLTTNKLYDVFSSYDNDGNEVLDMNEARQALKTLHLYRDEADLGILFEHLDTDCSGTLDWEEFKRLTTQASACNKIVDFIPLAEIDRIECQVESARVSACLLTGRAGIYPCACACSDWLKFKVETKIPDDFQITSKSPKSLLQDDSLNFVEDTDSDLHSSRKQPGFVKVFCL
jgi:hypothetical protein